MKDILFLITVIFGTSAFAHFECEGVCKYYYNGELRSSVVSGSGRSQSEASNSMVNSCRNYCDASWNTGCQTVDYSCSTPTNHSSPFSMESLQ